MYRIVKTVIGKSGKISEVELHWVDNDYDGGMYKRGRRSKIKLASWKNFVDLVAKGLVAGIRFNAIDKTFKFTDDNFSWEDIRSEDLYCNLIREGNPVIVYADAHNTLVSVPGKGIVDNYKDIDTLMAKDKINIPSTEISKYLSRKEIFNKLHSDEYKEFSDNNIGAAFNEELYKTGKNDTYSCLMATSLNENAAIVKVDKVFEAVKFIVDGRYKTRLIDLTNCKLKIAEISLSGNHNIQIKVGDIRHKFLLYTNGYVGKIDLQLCGSFTGDGTYNGVKIEFKNSKIDEFKITSTQNCAYSIESKDTDIFKINDLDKVSKFKFTSGYLPCDIKINYYDSNCGYENGRFYLSDASCIENLDVSDFKDISIFRCKELSKINIKAGKLGGLYLNGCKSIKDLNIDVTKVETGKFVIQHCEAIESFKVNLKEFNPDLYTESRRSVINTSLTYFTGDIIVNGKTDEQYIKALIGANNYKINKIDKLGIYALSYPTVNLDYSGITIYGLNVDRVRNLIADGVENQYLSSIKEGILDVPSDVSNIDIINEDVNTLKSIGVHSIRLNNYCKVIRLEGLDIQNSEYVSSIGKFAFADNKDITKFVCGDKLYVIDGFAFAGCNNLENLVLNESLREIRIGSLFNCKKIGISGSYDRERLKIDPLFRFRARDMHTTKLNKLKDRIETYEDCVSKNLKLSFRFTCIALVYTLNTTSIYQDYSAEMSDVLSKVDKHNANLYTLIKAEVSCYKYLKAKANKIGEEEVLNRCIRAMEYIHRHYDSSNNSTSAASTLYSFKNINMDKIRAIKSLDTILNV